MKNFFILLSFIFTYGSLFSQCERQNKYFKVGEKLEYEMYFKMGLISTEAGVLSLGVSEGSYKGNGDLKLQFITNTNGLANKIFAVHDTLVSYVSKDLVPMAYVKKAHEGGSFTDEELIYSYKSDAPMVEISTKRHKDGTLRFNEIVKSSSCIYDLVSVIYYARTLDFDNMKIGDVARLNFISGQKLGTAILELTGDKKVKSNNGKKYDCKELLLYFSTDNDADVGKDKENMKVYITSDARRIPIQIESKMKKVGSVKGLLKTKID